MNSTQGKLSNNARAVLLINITLVLGIAFSIGVSYYVLIVQNDYDVITQEGGPDLEE